MSNLWINALPVHCVLRALLIAALLGMTRHADGMIFDEKKSKYVLEGETVITYSVVIPEGKSLIIKPGARVIFDGYYSFTVKGLIIAEGTEDSPILFSALDRPSGSREPPQVPRADPGQLRHLPRCLRQPARLALLHRSRRPDPDAEAAGQCERRCAGGR